MSFSVGAAGTRDEVLTNVRERFADNYPDPAPGVEEILETGLGCAEDFLNEHSDEGNYSVTISGHAKQGDGDRNSMQVSVNAVS